MRAKSIVAGNNKQVICITVQDSPLGKQATDRPIKRATQHLKHSFSRPFTI